MKESKKTVLIIVAAAVLIAAMLAVFFLTKEDTAPGAKELTVQIVYDDVDKTVTINTDEEHLRGALEQESLVKGSESEFGLYITEVDGRVADGSVQEWWCITRDGGGYMETGADDTVIEDGDVYEITLKKGW